MNEYVNLSLIVFFVFSVFAVGMIVGRALRDKNRAVKSWFGSTVKMGVSQFKSRYRDGVRYFEITEKGAGVLCVHFISGKVYLGIPLFTDKPAYTVVEINEGMFWEIYDKQKYPWRGDFGQKAFFRIRRLEEYFTLHGKVIKVSTNDPEEVQRLVKVPFLSIVSV